MNRAIIMKDRRLIEALDYIDDEYIASAALYKMRAYAESARPLAQTAGQSVKKHWKHYLGFVACILVLALATPMFTRLPEIISSFAAGWGEGTTEKTEVVTHKYEEDVTHKYEYDTDTSIYVESSVTTQKYTETEEEVQWWNPGFWYLEYDGIEPLTEDQTLDIRKRWAEIWYDRVLNFRYKEYIGHYGEEVAQAMALEKAQEISAEYYNVLFNEYYYDEYAYLGIVNGCVIFRDTNPGAIMRVQLGDVKFDDHLFFLFKDGDFYWVSTAYKKGWLTDEDINTILEKRELFYAAYKEWKKDVQRRIEEKIEFGGE